MYKHFLSFSLFAIFLTLNISAAQDYGLKGLGPLDLGIGSKSFWNKNLDPKYVTPSSFPSGDCFSVLSNTDPKTIPFAMTGARISGLASCSDVKKTATENRFTELYCKSAIECSNAKTSNDNPGFLGPITIPKYLGEDYASVELAKEVVRMDKVEALRKFAEKKYGKDIAKKCKSPFDYDSNDAKMMISCDARVVDNGFNRLQDNCTAMRLYCFNKGLDTKNEYKAFQSSYRSKPGGMESITQAFFKDRNELLVNDALANDSEMLASLADIISSKDNSTIKMQNVFSKLGEYKKHNKLDPIFGFDKDYLDSSKELYQKSIHYKFFEKLLQSKTINLASAKKAIEDYRLVTAKNLLGNTCLETAHFSNICQDATKIKNSKHISKLYDFHTAALIPPDNEDERFALVKEAYPQGVQDFDDYKAVMDAERCRAFNIGKNIDITAESVARFGVPLPDYDLASYYKSSLNNENSPSSQNLIKVFGKPNFSINDFGSKAIDGVQIAGPVKLPGPSEAIRPSNEGTLSSSISDSLKSGYKETVKGSNATESSNLTGSNNLYNNSFNNPGHSYLESNDNGQKSSDEAARDSKNSISNTNSVLNDKIAELNKKLSSTEENLERIKSEKEAADTEKEHQQKINEENKTIADLKNQIAEMKNESKVKGDDADSKNKISTIATTGIDNAKEAQNVSAKSSEESRASAVNKDQDVNSGNVNHSANSTSFENTPQGVSAKSSSTQGTGNALSSSAKTGVVLTKIDGMSSEKASEAITDKIIEMDGQPFYIEEGGMVKEIIPIIKNGKVILDEKGKPLFEKIVKGKVGESRFARGKVQTKKGRVPASLNDTADLKRDDEERLKYERAEYIKLKQITKDLKLK
ncbi:MAG: FlxA-like family protein [Bacteriovorax sp.]|nr:FlxA-like family protein [Bacteriovorax sp.]